MPRAMMIVIMGVLVLIVVEVLVGSVRSDTRITLFGCMVLMLIAILDGMLRGVVTMGSVSTVGLIMLFLFSMVLVLLWSTIGMLIVIFLFMLMIWKLMWLTSRRSRLVLFALVFMVRSVVVGVVVLAVCDRGVAVLG